MPAPSRFHEITPSDLFDDAGPEGIPPAVDSKDKVLAVVKQHPDGVTAGAIGSALGIDPQTARKNLRELKGEREVYSKKHGRAEVWYPNGRLIHPFLQFVADLRGKPYRFSVQDGRYGPLIQIQERTFSLLDGENVEGAVFLEYSVLEDFIEALREVQQRFETIEERKEVQ